jgi:hypothetical protein
MAQVHHDEGVANVGQRRAEIEFTFVVGQHHSANGHRALLANFRAGHEGLPRRQVSARAAGSAERRE